MNTTLSNGRTEQLQSALASILPSIKMTAGECEILGRLPVSGLELVEQTGLFGCLVREKLGGKDLPFSILTDSVFSLAKVCTSTAWVSGLFAFHCAVAQNLPEGGRNEVFGDGLPKISGVLNGTRIARLVDAGECCVLDGVWDYCSGVDHANWLLLAGRLSAEGSQHLCAIRSSEISIDEDSWKVLGMRGTGSKTVRVNQVVVPKYRTVGIEQGRIFSGHAISFPIVSPFATCLAAVIAGLAEGALSDFVTTAKSRSRRDGNKSGEDPRICLRVGEAAGLISVAKGALRSMSAEIENSIAYGNEMDVFNRVKTRNEASTIVRLCLEAVRVLISTAGGAAIRQGSTLERAARDIYTAASHFMIVSDITAEQEGRVRLGFAPNSAY